MALSDSVIAMLVADVVRRLEAMAKAIVEGHDARCNYQRPRIEDILQSLEASACAGQPGDPAVYRAARRMAGLAALQGDPARCQQAIALLGRIAGRGTPAIVTAV